MNIGGIHHVTAIAGDAKSNIEFYSNVLGLRLIKKTINYDDPETYHFYYGDGLGTPGTLLTFFPWSKEAEKGRGGVHQINVISLAIPTSSLGYWTHRLMEKHVRFTGPTEKYGAKVLSFRDPDGITLELVTTGHLSTKFQPWQDAPVPADYAIRGIYSVQLWLLDGAPTSGLLQKLDYEIMSKEANITRLEPKSGFGVVEVRATGQFLAGQSGVGTIHHLAFRVPDDATQLRVENLLKEAGIEVTEIRDRKYFRSIYFREPGGVLFEIATDSPGFTIDETLEYLGESLMLPSYLESQRSYLESVLPDLNSDPD